MTTTLLLLTVALGQPPQAPTRPAVEPPQAPVKVAVKTVTYADVYARVKAGRAVVLYVGVPRPKTAPDNSYHFDEIPGVDPGVYDCKPRAGGEPVMGERTSPATPAQVKTTPHTDPAGTHRHRCPKDGTVWSHSPGGSHACPACGYDGPETHRHYTGPDPPTTVKPVTAKPKRVSLGGKWYDQYADGTLIACSA